MARHRRRHGPGYWLRRMRWAWSAAWSEVERGRGRWFNPRCDNPPRRRLVAKRITITRYLN
jgi:hypothetical protein